MGCRSAKRNPIPYLSILPIAKMDIKSAVGLDAIIGYKYYPGNEIELRNAE